MPLVTANGITIHYSLLGPSAARTVVLINGLADDHTTWGDQLPVLLAYGYRVLTFDNRGVGRSSKPVHGVPEEGYTAELLAQDLKGLVTVLKITCFHLMGVSMGGMIAQAYAFGYPEDLLSLTLACTYAAPGPFCSRMFNMWEEMAKTVGRRIVAQDVLLWCFTQDFFNNRTDELEEMEEALRLDDQPLQAYLSQLNVIQSFDSTATVGKLGEGNLGGKVLVLAGEEDILIPTQMSIDLAHMIPHAELRTVKGGHACMWEFPESFNTTFSDFIQQHNEY